MELFSAKNRVQRPTERGEWFIFLHPVDLDLFCASVRMLLRPILVANRAILNGLAVLPFDHFPKSVCYQQLSSGVNVVGITHVEISLDALQRRPKYATFPSEVK